MTKNISTKEILAAADMGAKEIWDEFSDDEQKEVKGKFWLLNRYMSVIDGLRESQELAVLKTNEYFNKNYMVVNKHPKLQWQLLCLAGNAGKPKKHSWQGFKKKNGESDSKKEKFLQELFPNMKSDDLTVLAKISSKKDLLELAKEYAIDIKL